MAASEHVQPNCRREDALGVVQTLQRAGHTAYFAGGCVRDMLWNLTPKDFDVATDAPPTRVRELFPKSQGVGQAFGVVLVRAGPSVIEVATFRADGSYSDGRRPDQIRFATPQEDAQRRDFTINGLFYDPIADRVIDFVNGQADIGQRVLRAIGDPAARFAEDYLRMMRAVRFTARFNLSLDDKTAAAIRANAHKLPRIAPERVGDELRATFATGSLSRTAELFDDLTLTPVLLRGIAEGPAAAEVKLLEHAAPTASFPLRLSLFVVSALLARQQDIVDLFAPERIQDVTNRVRQTLRLSNEDTLEVKTALAAGSFLIGELPAIAQVKRYLAQPGSASGIQLLHGLRRAGHAAERINQLLALVDSFEPDHIAPPPLIGGEDLQTMGYSPGPAFKRVLDAVYDAQLERRVTDKQQAATLAQSLMLSQPQKPLSKG